MVRICLGLALCSLLISGESAPGYRLFPGDRIDIEVFGHPDLQIAALVPAAGELQFPLIGAIAGIAGRTPEEVAAEITRRLADGYVRNPSVQVQVRELAPRLVAIIGAVRNPGPARLDPQRPTGALQAIGSAGGFDDDADRGAATIVRDDPANPGRKLALALPHSETPEHDVELQHGDVIVVPRADRIYVLGQVNYPRAVPVPADERLTVSKAVSLAGGFGRFARETSVQLVRRGEQPVVVDVQAVLAGRTEDPVLRAGDTVFVPESRF